MIDAQALGAEHWAAFLREHRPTVLVTAWSAPVLPASWIEEAGFPLRYICHITGTVRSFVPRRMIERGVLVTNWGATVSHTIAEHAVLLVLGCLRDVPRWAAAMRLPESGGAPAARPRTRTLRGRRVGLHGFGAIAREIVRRLKPFQVNLAAYSEGVPPGLFAEQGVERCESLEALFARSDVLIECEGLTPSTRGSVNARLLELLPEDAVFVNVGRSQVVDEKALAYLASGKRIRVGSDVFHCEPPLADAPLLDVAGALLSPHVAGPTEDTFHLCGDQALENLRCYLRGETPPAVITPEIYDRMT